MFRTSSFVVLFVFAVGCMPPQSVDKDTACQGMEDSCLLADEVDSQELDQVCDNVESTCYNVDEACESAPETCDSAKTYCEFGVTLDNRVQAVCDGLTASCVALQAACGNVTDAGIGDAGAQLGAE